MLSNQDQGHLRRVKQVSYKLNIPEHIIEEALQYTSEYIKNKIGSVDIHSNEILTQEEFESKLPIINIPNMGYLKPNYYKYKHIFKKVKEKEDKNKK